MQHVVDQAELSVEVEHRRNGIGGHTVESLLDYLPGSCSTTFAERLAGELQTKTVAQVCVGNELAADRIVRLDDLCDSPSASRCPSRHADENAADRRGHSPNGRGHL